MTGGFLVISPPFRGSVLSVLGRAMFILDQHSPYSYILLALVLGAGAIFSIASARPQ
jgi:hypothetical protein